MNTEEVFAAVIGLSDDISKLSGEYNRSILGGDQSGVHWTLVALSNALRQAAHTYRAKMETIETAQAIKEVGDWVSP